MGFWMRGGEGGADDDTKVRLGKGEPGKGISQDVGVGRAGKSLGGDRRALETLLAAGAERVEGFRWQIFPSNPSLGKFGQELQLELGSLLWQLLLCLAFAAFSKRQ